MKLFSLLLCLCFSMNVFGANALASSNSLQSLERGMDEYHYALTVEWDQQDKDFYNQKTQEFFAVVKEAISEGVDKDQIMKLLESKVKDREALEAVKLKINVLSSQANDPKELAELLRISSTDLYQRGASWDGEITLYVGIGLVGAAVLGYAIWWNVKYKCVNEETYRDCDWVKDRNGHNDYVCKNKTRCLEWVERNP